MYFLFLVHLFRRCSQGSVFVPYFSPCTLPLLVLSSPQHYFFHPPSFDSSIIHLQNARQQISSWITANLNSLNTDHSVRNLGFIFDEHLTFADQISSLQIVPLSYSPTSLYPSLPRVYNILYWPPPLFTLNLISFTASLQFVSLIYLFLRLSQLLRLFIKRSSSLTFSLRA